MEIDDLAILANILAHIRHGDSPKPMLQIGRRWREMERMAGNRWECAGDEEDVRESAWGLAAEG